MYNRKTTYSAAAGASWPAVYSLQRVFTFFILDGTTLPACLELLKDACDHFYNIFVEFITTTAIIGTDF